MNEDLIEQVRKFVEEECKKPTSKYGYDPYPFHFVHVHKYTQLLADKLNLKEDSREVIELAAWLHDIGSIIQGRDNHHITGTEIAERKLIELGVEKNKIDKVKLCILNHMGSVRNIKESIEEKIIADADAISNFDNISGIFTAAIKFEGKNQMEAQEEVKKKLTNCWNKLSLTESREILRDKYDAMNLLFS